MKRGEVRTVSAAGFAGKPRPAVVVQGDAFDATASVTICAFTIDETDAPLLRLLVEPSEANGLREPSRLMVDKMVTVSRDKLCRRIGRLADDDVGRLDRALMVFRGSLERRSVRPIHRPPHLLRGHRHVHVRDPERP